jgi:hypothetical protein
VDIRLPNGAIIRNVPEGATKGQISRKAIKLGLAKPEDFADRGIVSSLVGGTKRFASSIQTAAESLTGSPEEAGIAALKREKQISSENAPGADWSRVSEAYKKEGPWAATKEAVSQVPSAIAEMGPYMAAMGASARTGAMIGTALEGGVPGPGTVIGGGIGAFLPSLITRYGGNIEAKAAADQAEGKPVEINRAAALGAAVPQAGLDVYATAVPVLGRKAVNSILGSVLGKAATKGTTAELEKVAAQTLTRRVASGIGENLAVQGMVQPAQVMLTRLQAGQDLLSPEAINEYGHAAYMATLVSPMGAYSGVKERTNAREQLDRRNLALDNARQKLAEKIDAAKATPDAPDPPMSALNIQRLLGIKLTEASEIRRGLYERGDLVGSTGGGRTYKLFLNRDNLPKPEETAKPAEEAAATTAATPYTGEQLLGEFVERPPEEPTAPPVAGAPPAAATGEAAAAPPVAGAPPTETPPVVRRGRGRQQKPPAERTTSPENPIFQAGASLVKDMHEARTPITPENFRNALTPLVGEVPPLQIGNLLNALERNNLLSKAGENKVRTYTPPTEIPAFQPAATETGSESNINQLGRGDVGAGEPVDVAARSGVEPPVQGGERPAGVPEVNIAGRVENVGEPAAVAAAPEGRVEPALREQIEPAEVVGDKDAARIAASQAFNAFNESLTPTQRRLFADPKSGGTFLKTLTPEQKNLLDSVNRTNEEYNNILSAQKTVTKPPTVERVEPPVVEQAEPPAAPRPQTIPEGEPVPRSAQPSSPDVFAPTPEQARISTEVIDSGLVPGRGIERARRLQERQQQEEQEKQKTTEAPPEEGVSVKHDSVAESLRAGNLGEALYRLREESSGKSPLSWLADRLLNIVQIRDDRTPLIKLEVARIAREQGIDKREAPTLHAALTKEVEKAILSDFDLTKYDFSGITNQVTKKGKPTAAAKLVQEFKPQVERMVPVAKGKAQFNRATGRLEFIKPEPEQQFAPVYNRVTGKLEDIPTKPLAPAQKPFTLDDLPKTTSPFKKTAFGGAKVFVEGNADLKGQHKAVVERLKREGKLAEYNPKTNTFYFTEAGLTDRTILHEMVHSATVDVMKKFLSGKMGELTDIQRQGAKEIVDVYNDTKAVLGDKFKNAYENEYEFITHAMTHEGFQRALSNFSAPKTAREKLRSAWDSFTLAVAKMVGLDKFARQKEMDLSSSRTLEPGRGLRRVRAEAADTMDNALLTVINAVGDILTVPKAGVEVEPLAARRPGRVARRRRVPAVQQIRPSTQPLGSTQGTFTRAAPKSRIGEVATAVRELFTRKGYEEAAFKLQNAERAWLVQDDSLQRMNELQRTGPNRNNTYEIMTGAKGKKEVLEKTKINPLMRTLGDAISAYNKRRGFNDIDEAAEHLGVLRMAANELEKRKQNYVENIPLKDAQVLTLNNQPISPAAYRDALLDYTVQDRDLVTNGEARRIKQQLEILAQRYGEIGGKSRSDRVPVNAADALDMNSSHYQVVGYDNARLNAWRRVLAREMRQYGPEIRGVFDAIDAINKERIAMEKEANYWTQATDNLMAVYGYEYYVPYKSMEQGTANTSFDLDSSARAGTQYRQFEDKARGHKQEITNPIFQIITDLDRAATRASTVGITESIKNQIVGPNPTLAGKLVEKVSFADKYNGVQKEDLSKYNVFFHHMPDGSTEVYSLDNKRLVEGLNGFNTNLNWFLRTANAITQFMGKQHTFYNTKFAPYNFARDVLTNSLNAAGKFGPVTSAKVIGAVARNMAETGLFIRAAKISWLYEKGDVAAIKNMKGTFAKNAYEYLIEEGGRGSYQKVLDIGTIEKRALKNNGYIKSWETFNQIFTTYADAFEFTSRVSTYGVIKNELIAQGKARGLNINDPIFKQGVRQGAAAFTKNTFNYEQVGEHGRALGSLYMFMRPSLTSAARVMDTLLPALQSVEGAMEQGPSILKITDPTNPNFARAEAARKAFKENYAKEKRNATIIMFGLMGAGAAIYNWTLSNAPTDSSGRNVTATDDMSLWTRNVRIPMKLAGEGNEFINGPWGFGPGAFAAMGAQMEAYRQGNQKLGDMIQNLVPIVLDSFLPIPAPRFSPLENPTDFILDTIAFSPIKPLVEFSINTDSLGRSIYNDRINKYGDAYSGGQSVPSWIRDATEWMMNKTAGFDIPWNLKPEILNYLVGSYFDAIGSFINSVSSLKDLIAGNKDFDIKTDVPIISSFIGKRSSVDANKFSDLRADMERRVANLSAFEDRAEFDAYIRAHPQDYFITKLYTNLINGPLKEIQTQENQINSGKGLYSGLDDRARKVLLRENRAQKEQLMGEFVASVEALKAQAKAGLD